MAKKESFDPQKKEELKLNALDDSFELEKGLEKEAEPNAEEVLEKLNPSIVSGDSFSETKEEIDLEKEAEPNAEEVLEKLNPDIIAGSKITEQGIEKEAKQEKIKEFQEKIENHLEEKAKQAKEAREKRKEEKEKQPQSKINNLEKELLNLGFDSIEPLVGPKFDSRLKIKTLAIFKERADDLKIKAAEYWYQKNKKQLEKKGIVPESETTLSIYRLYLDKKGENDLADDKEYLEIIKNNEQYENIITGLSEEKPLVETYYSAMKEINNLIEKEKQNYSSKVVSLSGKRGAGELEKAQITANLKIQDWAEAGVKIAELFTNRNFNEEAEKTIEKPSREKYTSLDSIRERKLELMKNLKTDEEIDILEKYGWKVEIKKSGLFSLGHTIYKKNGVVMRDIATNIFGSYNKDEKRDYLRNVLHAEIKRELNDNFNSIEKENKKQINNYRFTKFLEILENPEKNIKEYVKRKNQESFNDLKITKKGMEEIREIARYDEKKDSSNVNVKEVISRAWEIFRNLEQTPKHQSDVDVFSAIDREKIKKGITKQDINNFLN
ncbi:MAG: hypothetical protein WC427_03065 [Candidatus Paceibacterota bacterium]